MAKDYSNLIKDEFNRQKFIAVDLVDFFLEDEQGNANTLSLCNGGFDIESDGVTYQAQGDFIGFSSVKEEFDVKIGKFTISLTALNQQVVDDFTTSKPEGKRVRIRKAFLDFQPFTLDPVDTPIILFDGQIFNYSITETNTTATLEVSCSTLFADFERRAGRRTTNSSNWLFQGFTRDRIFDKAGFVGNTEFLWGRTK